MFSNPVVAISSALASLIASNNAITAFNLARSGGINYDGRSKARNILYVIVALVFFVGYGILSYLELTSAYYCLTDTSIFRPSADIKYPLLALSIILALSWIAIFAGCIYALVKWIKSKSKKVSDTQEKDYAVVKISSAGRSISCVQEYVSMVSARILAVRAIKNNKLVDVDEIPASDSKRNYVVTLRHGKEICTVSSIRTSRKLKKGDKVQATLVEKRYSNGKVGRKLIVQ